MYDDAIFIADLITPELKRGTRGRYALDPRGAERIHGTLRAIGDPARFRRVLLELIRFACFLNETHRSPDAACALLRVGELIAPRLTAMGHGPDSNDVTIQFRRMMGERT